MNELIIFTWENYVPPEVIAIFERETGIHVTYVSFSSNEEMYAVFRMNTNQFDIILCSDYIIYRMIAQNMLHEIDRARVSNFGNINPAYMGKYFDPGNRFSIPYSTGSPLLVYDSARVSETITSFRCLWNESLRGRIVLLDDVRDVLGMVLLMLGECVNSTDEEVLDKVLAELLILRPNVIAFNSDFPHRSIITGDADVGFMYGSQATAAREAVYRNTGVDSVRFVFPEEGVSTFVDSFVISANAPNIDNAYIFLDFILGGEISAMASSIINYGNTNNAAVPFLPTEFLENESVNIPANVRNSAQYFRPLGDGDVMFDRIWTIFRAAN